MLRYLLIRGWWSSMLFGVAAVGFTAKILILPSIALTLALSHPILPAGLSLAIQATSPLVLVLRRFRIDGPEALLADIFLPWACLFGRPVWLENAEDVLVRGHLNRYSPNALAGQLLALAALWWSLLGVCEPLAMTSILVLVFAGSTAILDASVGNSGGLAASFLASATTVGPVPSSLPAMSQMVRPCLRFVWIYVITYVLWFLWHKMATATWSPFSNCVRNRFDRLWLAAEMYVPICFFSRFIHGGPAVVRELRSTEGTWRPAISLLLKRARYVIMDVSEIEIGSGLAWELKSSYIPRTKLLLTCECSRLTDAVSCVRAVIPNAILLPSDFYDIERLRTVNRAGPQIVQTFSYGEGDDMKRFYAQSGFLFGQVSIADWFEAIKAHRHASNV